MRLLPACAIAALLVSGCGPGAANTPPGASRAPPDVARIVCTAKGTRLLTPAVRPQPDGVHVMLSQAGGAPATLETDQGGGDKPRSTPLVLHETARPREPGLHDHGRLERGIPHAVGAG